MLTGISGSKQVRRASSTCASITVSLRLSMVPPLSPTEDAPAFLFDAQLQFSRARHSTLTPRRFPNQFHIGFIDAGNRKQLLANIRSQELSHAAALGSQGKAHLSPVAIRRN